MEKRKYSTIVFDLGNVLLPFNHQNWVKNYNEIENGLGDRYYRKYLDNYLMHRDYEAGKITDEEFITINLEWLENKIDAEKFCEMYSDIFSANKDVIELLPKLKLNYNLVLLSNTSGIHKKFGWENNKFLENFDELILSHEIGAVKPEEKIYRAVENFTKQPSETHIFIDDVLEYSEAAKSFGWDGIQFIGYDNLTDEFKSRGIKF